MFITATVEVKGLPENCPNFESENSFGDPAPQAEKLDEYAGDFSQIDKKGFDKIIRVFKNDPISQLFIFNRYKKSSSQAGINKRMNEVKNYLIKAGINAERMTFVRISAESDLMQFWLVPPGATPPTPE